MQTTPPIGTRWAAELESRYLPRGIYTVEIVGGYQDGSPAIEIRDVNEPQLRVTTCLAGDGIDPPPAGFCYVKTWSENEGILEALIAKGILAEPECRISVGPWGTKAARCRILAPEEVIR